jgi:Ca2+-binding RTX toxin-like protein
VGLQNGTVLNVYVANGDLMGQVVNADGSRSGNPVILDPLPRTSQLQLSSIEATGQNRFVVSYLDTSNPEMQTAVTSVFSVRSDGTFAQIGGYVGGDISTQSNSQYAVSTTGILTGLGPENGGFVTVFGSSIGEFDSPTFRNVLRVEGREDGNTVRFSRIIQLPEFWFVKETDIAHLSGGRYAVVTTGKRDTADTDDLSLRILTADGFATRSAPFDIASSNLGVQKDVSVTALQNGTFVVVWQSFSNSPTDGEIRARVFDADGNPLSNDVLINAIQSAGTQRSPTVMARNDGSNGFLVSWDDAQTSTLRVAAFDALAGRIPGSDTVVATGMGAVDANPSITWMKDGRYAISWIGDNAIHQQIFDPRSTAQVVTLVGSGNDQFAGTDAFNDRIDGGAGDDRVYGAGGNDTLYGGAGGNDHFDGGEGTDTVDYTNTPAFTGGIKINLQRLVDNTGAAAGDSYASIEVFNLTNLGDSFDGSNNAETILGGGGEDEIRGAGGADSINGGANNDYLGGGAGVDVFDGGDNFDVVYYNDVGIAEGQTGVGVNLGTGQHTGAAEGEQISNIEGVFGSLGRDTLTSGTRGDYLYGWVGDDRLFGEGGDDFLYGDVGGDSLDGGLGVDEMRGGQGNDTYIVDTVSDRVIEEDGQGADKVFVSGMAAYTLAGFVENLEATNPLVGSAAINLTGNNLANEITGNASTNIINGEGGNDTLRGRGGGDSMNGGAGSDTYMIEAAHDANAVINDSGTGLDERDRVVTTIDFSLVNTGVEELFADDRGRTSGLVLVGNQLNNGIIGTRFADTLDGRTGIDILVGGTGNDTYIVDDASDDVNESGDTGGYDVVRVRNSYTLNADMDRAHVERLEVESVASSTAMDLTGNGHAQLILGNNGANRIDGKGGADSMQGFGGNDTYVVDNVGDSVIETSFSGVDRVLVSGIAAYTLTDHVENLEATGDRDIALTGNGIANEIVGNSGANTIDGGENADRMEGHGGNDIYAVDSVGDVVIEASGGGTDTVNIALAGPATYALASDAEIEVINIAGVLNVSVVGSATGNTINGNDGNNLIDGGGGSDVLRGGGGNDTYVIDGEDIVEDTAGTDEVRTSVSYTLAGSIENLKANSDAGLALTGNALRNAITGRAGNDTLYGGADTEVDELTGGLGNDVYVIDGSAEDRVVENANGGRDEVRTSRSYTLVEHVEVLTATGTGNVALTGNSDANTITGNAGANYIDGRGGADVMAGLGGNDTYIVDAGDSVVEGNDSGSGDRDVIITGLRQYLLSDTVFVEVLEASGTAADRIDLTGNRHANELVGHAGANRLDGGLGADQMSGGAGQDTYVVDNVGDTVTETGSDIDLIVTSINLNLANFNLVENMTVADGALDTDGSGIDLTGNDLDNALTGNEFANQLRGGAGNDILDGRGGADAMDGCLGNDTFHVDNAQDVVTDEGGDDTVITSVSLTLAENSSIEELRAAAGVANVVLTGNSSGNRLTANDQGTVLDGGLGADTLQSGAGDDTLYIRDRSDVVLQDTGGIDTAYIYRGNYTAQELLAQIETLRALGIENVEFLDGTAGNTVATAITLQGGEEGNGSVDENAGLDAVVGVLGNNDTDVGDTFSYSFEGGALVDADGRFKIVEGANGTWTIQVNNPALLNQSGGTHTVRVTVNDGRGGVYTQDVTIQVNDVSAGNTVATAITLQGGEEGNGSVDENAGLDAVVGVLGNNDTDVGDTFSYSFEGGALVDADGRFKIVEGANGTWTIQVNNPALLNQSGGTHTVRVTVNDGRGGVYTQDVTIQVNDVGGGGGPVTGVALSTSFVVELTPTDSIVGRLSPIGGAEGDTYAYRLVDDQGGRFYVDGNFIMVKSGTAIDFEDVNLFELRVRLSVNGVEHPDEFAIPLNVLDLTTENATGGDAGEVIRGGSEIDVLNGVGGDDRLYGSFGNDALTGGEGADTFVFDTAASSINIDAITDFNVAQGDQIWLSGQVFGLGAARPLNQSAFATTEDVLTEEHRVIYDYDSGFLLVDIDGSGEETAVIVANIGSSLVLSHTQFMII